MIDTNSTLTWLDHIDAVYSESQKKNFLPFTFDFQALYDSLTPNLVVEALRYSIKACRKQWSVDFTEWLIELINISLSSGIGVFKDTWYKSVSGISTGGSFPFNWPILLFITF